VLFVKWSFYAFIVSLVCIVIITLRLNYFNPRRWNIAFISPFSHSGDNENSVRWEKWNCLQSNNDYTCVLWKSFCPLYPSQWYKRGLNSFWINSPSRIQWKSRQYHAERTIHIEFKADFTGSQRIIRLRDSCSRVRTGKMNIPC